MTTPYTINLKSDPDTPNQIADKLNTLSYAIEPSVVRDVVTKNDLNDELSSLRSTIETKIDKASKKAFDHTESIYKREDGRNKLTDQRWHGAGSGTSASSLPSQTGNSGKYLSTDGSNALWSTVATGTGNVVGPASATDKGIVRFNSTTGKLIQDSSATLADNGTVTAPGFNSSRSNSWVGFTDNANYFRGVTHFGNSDVNIVDASGNVGIGTITPAAPLDVSVATDNTLTLAITNATYANVTKIYTYTVGDGAGATTTYGAIANSFTSGVPDSLTANAAGRGAGMFGYVGNRFFFGGIAGGTAVPTEIITIPTRGTNALNTGIMNTAPTEVLTIGTGGTTAGTLSLAGATSGRTIVNVATAASGTLTLPSATDTLVGKATTDALTNKDLTSGTNTFPTFNQNTTGSAAKLTTARTIAGVSFDGTANISIASTNLSDTASVVLLTSTQTLTNKRITKRTGTTTSSATPTINTDNVDFYSLTAQAVDITSFTTNLSGTPTEAQKLWIAITGTASRAITWGTSFEASTVALPTTTSSTSRLDVGFIWNTVSGKWRCVATA